MGQLMDKMDQIVKLKNGVGVQNLIDAAYKILGNPMVMHDTEYKLKAYTQVETDDPIWNELIELGTFGEITQRFFGQVGFIEDVANSSIAYLSTDMLKYDRMNGKLFSKNNVHIANLVIVACNKLFEDGDQKIFEIVCRLLSKEIRNSEVYQDYEQAHQEVIIERLLNDEYDIKFDVAQVETIYCALETHLYLVVVDTSLNDSAHAKSQYYRNMLKQIKPAYIYAIYSGYIVFIISTSNDTFNVSRELGEHIKVFERHNMYAGISSMFENLFDLSKYYIEALRMMRFAFELRCDQRIFPYCASSKQKLEQIISLKNGEGIQYFLDRGTQIFGNPIIFHDMELNLLGCAQNIEIKDPIFQELIAYGTSSYETIELFRSTGMIDIMDKVTGGAYLMSDEIEYDRISWRIYNSDNIRIGCTSIAKTTKDFTDDELVLFGIFSLKFSQEVSKIEFYNNYGQIYSGTIISRLLSGKKGEHLFYSEDIGNLYNDFKNNFYLVVADAANFESDEVNLTYLRKQFSVMDTLNRFAFYSNYIIIIVSMDDESLIEKDGFGKIVKFFEDNRIYAGVSSCFNNIHDLKDYYLQAKSALDDGLKNMREGDQYRIFFYKSVGA